MCCVKTKVRGFLPDPKILSSHPDIHIFPPTLPPPTRIFLPAGSRGVCAEWGQSPGTCPVSPECPLSVDMEGLGRARHLPLGKAMGIPRDWTPTRPPAGVRRKERWGPRVGTKQFSPAHGEGLSGGHWSVAASAP